MKSELRGMFYRGLRFGTQAFSSIVGISIFAGAFMAGYHWYKYGRKRRDEEREDRSTLLDSRRLLEIYVPVDDPNVLRFNPDEVNLSAGQHARTHVWFLHATERTPEWLMTDNFDVVMEAQTEVVIALSERRNLAHQVIRVPTAVFVLVVPSLYNGDCLREVSGLLTVYFSLESRGTGIPMSTIKLWGKADAVTSATGAVLRSIDVAAAAVIIASSSGDNSTIQDSSN